MTWLSYIMVYLGSALMVYNILGFVLFARRMRSYKSEGHNARILYPPIVLLVLFLIGYLAIGILYKPDLLVSGILFGGSIFVFAMYRLVRRITDQIIESERREAFLIAADESNRAKSAFLASISHEMRTPMNVILGLDAIALEQKHLPEKAADCLAKIGASARHLLGLINNILELNSIDSGELVVKKEPFALLDVTEQVNAIVGTIAEEKGLKYHFMACECVDRRYIGDEMQLKNVLFALLDNAIKYTDAPGSVRLSLMCGEAEGNVQTVRFIVSDSGIGIDSDFLPHLFDVFSKEQEDSTDSRGGSGLGLALTHKIVKSLGGSITVESKKFIGSTFTVTLPLTLAVDEAPASEDPVREASLEGRRVLLAEDIPENAEIVMDLLELEGVTCDHAGNGQAALDLFRNSAPGYYDAILMDLRMPEMDGLTATRAIRALPRSDAAQIPIIALTANAFQSDINQSLDAGMNEHLAKPTDSATLYSTLKRWIV